MKHPICWLAAVYLIFTPLWLRAQVVTTTADSGAGSLRTVVAGASPGAIITFAAGLSGQIIQLSGTEIVLNKNVNIDASALAQGIQIKQLYPGYAVARIFAVTNNTTVGLRRLTLVNGTAGNAVGAGLGGAIYNLGTLSLTNCTLALNGVFSVGGAIFNDIGALTLTGCTLDSNSAHSGGAIYNAGGTSTLNECTLTENFANTSGFGGSGGAIYVAGGSVFINQCTIAGNASQNYYVGGQGGGVENGTGNSNSLAVFNSIVTGNNADTAPNIGGPYTVNGTNLLSGDPLLLPLGYYGGPTQTMPPRTNSPALNGGSDFVSAPGSLFPIATVSLFPDDQRGLPRWFGAHVDIGAVELQSPLIVSNAADAGPGSLRQAVSDADPSGSSISFASNLSGQTILLTSGEVPLTNSTVIDASALPGGVTLSAGGSSRIFNIGSGPSVVLRGLTLTQGSAPGGDGGAVYSAAGSTLQISRCTLLANSALEGGAVLNDGALQIDDCTFTDNSASYGGALQCRALTSLIQCTMAGNYATYGGGVFSKSSTLTINNSIIADNTPAGAGHDLYSQLAALVCTNANLVPSVFEDRPTAADLGPAPLTAEPLLAALGSYGGPTQTMPPLTNSPAIDAGGDSTTNAFSTDQRGLPRLAGAHVDLGAVEFLPPVVLNANDSGPGSLREVITYASPGATILFAPYLSGQSIALSSGELAINRNLAIDASALPGGISLNGSYTYRVLDVMGGATAMLRSLTIENGFDSNQGGGINNAGSMTLERCTLTGNGGSGEIVPNFGGGIYNGNTLTLNQCTLSGNLANYGGGIYNASGATLVVNQSTLSENQVIFDGSDLYSYGMMTLFNTIATDSLRNGVGGGGSVTLLGNNLTTGDPQLASLANNGGPTLTMLPLAASPAIDAGDDSATAIFATDQRGSPRRSGLHVDIGAVEVLLASGLPSILTGVTRLNDGSVQFGFTNLVGASFTVFESTNVALPLNLWSNLGPALETPAVSGQFQFTDPQATNDRQRFYRVRSP
jgi:hypothetical protein